MAAPYPDRETAAHMLAEEAALRVVRDYDGVHRLALAVSAWAKVLADQGGRDAALDERSES